MDFRTTLRELDEVIVKAQVAINNDLTDTDATPPCNGRRRKRRHLIALQAHLSRLRRFRAAVKRRRPAGSWLH